MEKLDTSEVPEVKQLSEAYHEPLNRIVVKSGVEIAILDIENILYIESQDDYVEFHTKDGRKHLKNQRRSIMSPHWTIHDLYVFIAGIILNITELSKLEKFGKESYIAILKNGENISVSLSGYGKLKEQLDLG